MAVIDQRGECVTDFNAQRGAGRIDDSAADLFDAPEQSRAQRIVVHGEVHLNGGLTRLAA